MTVNIRIRLLKFLATADVSCNKGTPVKINSSKIPIPAIHGPITGILNNNAAKILKVEKNPTLPAPIDFPTPDGNDAIAKGVLNAEKLNNWAFFNRYISPITPPIKSIVFGDLLLNLTRIIPDNKATIHNGNNILKSFEGFNNVTIKPAIAPITTPFWFFAMYSSIWVFNVILTR